MDNVLASCIRRLVAVVFLLLAAPSFAAQVHAQSLDGTFLGMDGATGITVRLSPGGQGYVGEIQAAGGGRADIHATLKGQEAEAPLFLRGQQGTVRFSPRPIGLSMVWTPQGGGPQLVYAFRRQNIQLPQISPGFVPAPPAGSGRINPMDFLNSYEFWDPNDVARIYDAVQDKYRVIIRAFPAVHGDILWKLCQAGAPPASLGQAMRGQGVTCASLVSKLRAVQGTGGFARFKERVSLEKSDALLAVECARGIHNAYVCTEAARRTQQASASIITLSSILNSL